MQSESGSLDTEQKPPTDGEMITSGVSNSNNDVISLTSSDEDQEIEEEQIPGSSRIKRFKKSAVDLTQVSLTQWLTPVRSSPGNVILLDSDDEGPKNDKNSNGNDTSGKEDSRATKNKLKNPLNALLKKNGITVRQKGEVVSLVDSDSDGTDIERKQRNLEVCKTKYDNDEDYKNRKRKKRNGLQRRNTTPKDSTDGKDISVRSHDKNESIIIDDSDDATEKENHCENDIEPFPVNIDKTSSSAATSKNESTILFKKFLKIVEEKIVDSTFEEVLPKKVSVIERYFKKCGEYANGEEFKQILSQLIEKIQTSQNTRAAKTAVLAFHKAFEHLRSHVSYSINVELEQDPNYPKIKKLEKTIKLLQKKIKQLNEAEVDMYDDNDNDSAYIMVDKFTERLNKVCAKYCQYTGINPHSGLADDKFSYINSKYNAINRALTKKYRKQSTVPSFYELKKFIEKVAKKENLNLSEQELRRESESSFEYLGNLKQKKRKHELFARHLELIEFTEDPAANDASLENVLKKSYAEGKEKIDKIFELYVKKQNQGEDYESAHEGETSEESDTEKVENNEETENEESSVQKTDENKENNQEITKMDKGKNLINGNKTVIKKSKQITTEESNELPTNDTAVIDKLEDKIEEIEMTVNNKCEDDTADTSLKDTEDVMELD